MKCITYYIQAVIYINAVLLHIKFQKCCQIQIPCSIVLLAHTTVFLYVLSVSSTIVPDLSAVFKHFISYSTGCFFLYCSTSEKLTLDQKERDLERGSERERACKERKSANNNLSSRFLLRLQQRAPSPNLKHTHTDRFSMTEQQFHKQCGLCFLH